MPFAYAENSVADEHQSITAEIDSLDKPLYTPFVERYVLDELKQWRVSYREEIATDPALELLRDYEPFKQLVSVNDNLD